MVLSDRLKARFGAILINVAIFSFLPSLYYIFHKSPEKISPIQVDLVKFEKEKIKPKEKPIEKREYKKQIPKTMFKPELRRRISFELDPGALASEVDLTASILTYDLSEVDQVPLLVDYVEPEYPENAIIKEIEGLVTLKILINREGKVIQTKILDNSGFYEFGRAASRAVKRWRFGPAKVMGMPVAVWCIQTVRFKLEKK